MELQRIEIKKRQKESHTPWVIAAKNCLLSAERFAAHGHLDQAWTALKAADRELIHALDDAERMEEATRLRLEAESKLTDWRQAFVLERLLPKSKASGEAARSHLSKTTEATTPSEEPAVAVSAALLIECRRVLDDALDNKYRKISLLQHRVRWSAISLIATLALAIAAWLVADGTGFMIDSTTNLLSDWRSLLMVVSLGALGAALSGLLSLRDNKLSARVPDLAEGWAWAVWRPAVGAASAFALVLILQSGVGGLALDSSAALVASLIAGSTEHVVSSAIASASAAIQQKSDTKSAASGS